MKTNLGVVPSKGFTLIELLVVIAIIGILAGIVLASLSSSRAKANDATIKAELNSIRTAASEQFYLVASSYGSVVGGGSPTGICTSSTGGSLMWADTTSNMAALITDITSKVGGTTRIDCGTIPTAWSVAVQLPGGGFWCVDSVGASRGTASTTGTTYAALTGATGAHQAAGATVCR